MNILVANIGSTSFKYRLYAMPEEKLLARGGVERIGAQNSRSYVVQDDGRTRETISPVPDHAAAVSACLTQLTDVKSGCLRSADDLAAIGFKAVHAKNVSGVQIVNDNVLTAMEAYNRVAPAHNPPYIAAMRQLKSAFPKLPLVAAFETGFHQTTPDAFRYYAAPYEWAEKHGVLRHGFHGASHRYIAGRIAELMGRSDLRIVSCHLGGSSSLCAIRNGESVGASMGMSPQSGIPNNNRVGDFDPFAIPVVMQEAGLSLDEVLYQLTEEGGLKGLSGKSNDLRDVEHTAAHGDKRAKLALDVFVGSVRDWLGAFLVRLGGADAIVFTGGIGENSASMRSAVCNGLRDLGIEIDGAKNEAAKGEMVVSKDASRIAVWTMPTNEEIVVARQTFEVIKG
jgi:acetate kinase